MLVGKRRAGPLDRARAPARSRPAARRIRLDLPLPLGPLTCSASPGPSARSRPSNSSRPPRRSATSSNRSSGVHCGAFLERVHVVVAEGRNGGRSRGSGRGRRDARACPRRRPIRRGSGGGTAAPGRAACPIARRFARSAECLRRGRSARTDPRSPSRASVSSSANSSTMSTMSPRLAGERLGQRSSAARAIASISAADGGWSEAAHRRRIGARSARSRQACPPRARPLDAGLPGFPCTLSAERWPSGRRRSPGK